MNQPKAVIFDLDGTLYDKRFLKARIILHELRAHRFWFLLRERSARAFMRGKNYGDEDAFYEHFFHNISPRHPEWAERWYNEHYLPLQEQLLHDHYQVDYWVQERLDRLHSEGVKCVVYSDYGFAEQKLRAIGLDPSHFDGGIFDAPSLGGLKPSRKSSMRIINRLGLKPEEVLFIGDRAECDIAAARKIGAQYEFIFRKGHEVFFTSRVPEKQ